jgi:hypothetical protein
MIIDKNFISKEQQIKIYEMVSSKSIPLYLQKNELESQYDEEHKSIITEKTKNHFQFVHVLRGNNEIFSPYYDYINNNLFSKFLEKHNIECNQVLRSKINLTTSLDEDGYQLPHVDISSPHKVFLYYVNDSDGDTIIFNEKYNGEKQNLTIMDSITPEMGKAIFFDGLTYHAPTAPKKTPFRIVINIVFI